MRIPGCGFRLRRHPETTSQSERGFRDGLSAWAAIGKACPGLRCQGVFFTPAPCSEFDSPRVEGSVNAAHGRLRFDKHRIRFESEVCAENPRICFANTHRLRPPAGALARGLKTLARFLYARALHRVRFSAGGGDPLVRGHSWQKCHRQHISFGLGHCAENPRICFANPHRLRPPAGVLARGLKTLTRFLYARALHRVRFSAVRTRNKKAGRYEYLPACYLWWRRGESNSGPRKPPDWHLQAQSLV